MSSSLNSPTQGRDFQERIMSNLRQYQSLVDESVDEDESHFRSPRADKSFIGRTHQNIIDKFKNIDKIQEAHMRFSSNSHMVQDIVEDFIVLANKIKQTEYALSQIDIMKDYQNR